jgi:hypothetical protein
MFVISEHCHVMPDGELPDPLISDKSFPYVLRVTCRRNKKQLEHRLTLASLEVSRTIIAAAFRISS